MSKHIIDLTEFSKKRDIADLTYESLKDSIFAEIGKNLKDRQKLDMLIAELNKRNITITKDFRIVKR